MGHADDFGPGDIGAVAKLKETHAGDMLQGSDRDDVKLSLPPLPSPVMAFAVEAAARGDVEAVRSLPELGSEQDIMIPGSPA